jgi:hypothetical protein
MVSLQINPELYSSLDERWGSGHLHLRAAHHPRAWRSALRRMTLCCARRPECALRLRRESSCDGHLAHHYHASWKALLWDCYGQVFGPRLYLPKLADGLCRDPDVSIRLHPHLIWQATESYVEGGNAFGLVFHLGFLTRLGLTAIPETAFGSIALVVAAVAVVVAAVVVWLGGCAALNTDLRIAISTSRRILLSKARPAASERVDMLHARR